MLSHVPSASSSDDDYDADSAIAATDAVVYTSGGFDERAATSTASPDDADEPDDFDGLSDSDDAYYGYGDSDGADAADDDVDADIDVDGDDYSGSGQSAYLSYSYYYDDDDDDAMPVRGRRVRGRGLGPGPSDRARGRAIARDRGLSGEADAGGSVRRGRLTELERARLAARREDEEDAVEVPDGADRWSTWGQGELGPEPLPDWVITEEGAVDTLRGVLKTGKEAEVHLVLRSLPGTDRSVLLAEKRYRSADHRLFHRDAGYLEGRRTRESRIERAIARRTTFGLKIIAEQWAAAEFAALSRLWLAGAPVPYPVERNGTDLLLEFIGDDDGVAAPRLVQLRCTPDEVISLWDQLCSALCALAQAGLAHGDLSPYNILVDAGRLVLIDLPQVVDVVANPRGVDFLRRDVENVVGWFASNGLPDAALRGDDLLEMLCFEARLTPSSGI